MHVFTVEGECNKRSYRPRQSKSKSEGSNVLHDKLAELGVRVLQQVLQIEDGLQHEIQIRVCGDWGQNAYLWWTITGSSVLNPFGR